MAQLERTRRSTDSPKTPKPQHSPTFEQLIRVDEACWSPTTTPRSGRSHGHDECLSPNSNKKSVLSKVKERAKKLKHSLSGRKTVHENEYNTTPTYVDRSLDDNEVDDEVIEDPEYLGAPMYESEAAPENLKENARQHPRATPVVVESHQTPNRTKSVPENDNPVRSPNKAATESLSEKLPCKIAGLTIAIPEEQETAAALTNDNSSNVPLSSKTWDKGVSVKEYFMNKLEPGDDERALSHAITEAISPRGVTINTGVVEKVKEAVTSFFWQEENVVKSPAKPASSFSAPPRSLGLSASTRPTNFHSFKLSYAPTANSSPHITRSANASEGKQTIGFQKPIQGLKTDEDLVAVLDEENHGKRLQAN